MSMAANAFDLLVSEWHRRLYTDNFLRRFLHICRDKEKQLNANVYHCIMCRSPWAPIKKHSPTFDHRLIGLKDGLGTSW